MNKYPKQSQKKDKQNSFWNNVFSNEEKNEATEVVDQNLPSLSEIRVEDIAIPKADIIAASDDMSSEELSEIFRKYRLSRIPIFKDTLDNPLGLLHLKDFALGDGFNKDSMLDIKNKIRPLIFVPPSMNLKTLLQKMQTERIHMALVIDEYGGTDGLVTIEDLIEEIIGEIEDELFEEDLDRIKIYDNYIDSSARASIEEINDIVGKSLFTDDIDEEINTIGGLVFVLAGRVPQRGELINHPLGFEIEITDADSRRIKKVRLRIKADRE